jgi:hypothetical protein
MLKFIIEMIELTKIAKKKIYDDRRNFIHIENPKVIAICITDSYTSTIEYDTVKQEGEMIIAETKIKKNITYRNSTKIKLNETILQEILYAFVMKNPKYLEDLKNKLNSEDFKVLADFIREIKEKEEKDYEVFRKSK